MSGALQGLHPHGTGDTWWIRWDTTRAGTARCGVNTLPVDMLCCLTIVYKIVLDTSDSGCTMLSMVIDD